MQGGIQCLYVSELHHAVISFPTDNLLTICILRAISIIHLADTRLTINICRGIPYLHVSEVHQVVISVATDHLLTICLQQAILIVDPARTIPPI